MAQITTLPDTLIYDGWRLAPDGKAILKTFKFASFADAMTFMLRISYAAEAADHHPEWTNIYNRVDVRLTTHDAGGLTQKDLDLAATMNVQASPPR